ncbi:hypothetical protein A9W99_05715 [Mycobacterium sp. 1164966.3]|uniref:hypothetical protein n=1 Tax=Mycobacterium sp. 1164966.3 TaxID=1856861 RepID=UPI0007FD3519|nr:hypothetical protein [Mycobacterium sp. 1164966.3]OBA83900.1 hypothetical protein A9W99_05715 [Mycobacterium sp. 1164966.3]
MPRLREYFARHYGSRPLHLLTMVVGFALFGYVLATFKPGTLWNSGSWWQSIIVWFAAAVIVHDLLLFPLYALADRIIGARLRQLPPHRQPKVPARNHIRIPALAAGLTLLIFLPGIVRQGAPTYLAATGETQQPFLGRWLLLTAFIFATSAVAYVIRLAVARRKRRRKCPQGDARPE